MNLTKESKDNIQEALKAIKNMADETYLLKQLLEIARRISADAVRKPESNNCRGTEVKTSLILELRLTIMEIDKQEEIESD